MKPGGADCALRVVVRGRVQGVGFRWWAQRHGQALGLRGGVFNRSDGGVEVLAEGPRDILDGLLADLREGPSGSSVTAVEADWMTASGAHAGFEIWSSR